MRGTCHRSLGIYGLAPATLLLAGLILASPASSAQGELLEFSRFTGDDVQSGDQFGGALAISGNTAFIGSDRDNHSGFIDAGSLTIHKRHAGGSNTWGQVAKLVATSPGAFDRFGRALAVSGDTLVVGVPRNAQFPLTGIGSVLVFERAPGPGETWTQVAELSASDSTGPDSFGAALAVELDTIAVGATGANVGLSPFTGAVYIYERDAGGPGAWGEVQRIIPDGAQTAERIGSSVLLSDSTLFIGAPFYDPPPGSGSVYVFERDLAGTWGEAQQLPWPWATGAGPMGVSLALDGDTLIAGGGGVSVYRRASTGNTWTFDHAFSVPPSTQQSLPSFGAVVAISGNEAIASWATGGSGGAAYYTRNSASDPFEFHNYLLPSAAGGLGTSIGISGPTFLLGATYGSQPPGPAGGIVVLFDQEFVVETYCVAGTSANGCTATMGGVGTPSATASTGFFLTAQGAAGNKNGMFFFTTAGKALMPWGNGTSFMCVAPPRMRAGLLAGTGTNGMCGGSFSQDLNARWCPSCPKPGQNPGVGAWVQAQLWYRDPQSSSNQSSSLSDALEFTVMP